MPFDVTDNHESFQLVTRIGTELAGEPIGTHWSYWSKDCDHLADVFICLTDNDTVVVNPRELQSQVQVGNENQDVGPIVRLDGVKGFVTVTAFEADTGVSGRDCRVDPLDQSTADDELVGGWTIANTSTNAAFGSDAIGLFHDEVPSASDFLEAGIFLQTFNPQTLEDSSVILIGLETASGNGAFEETEVGPIRMERGSPAVCCDVAFTDNIEVRVSLPDVCFECAHFAPIASNIGPDSLIPASATVDTSGFVQLTNCSVFDDDGLRAPIIDEPVDNLQFIFAYHGQAVGPFGVVVSGKYSGDAF